MTEKIITCPTCLGRGKIGRSERVDYHHRIDEEWDEKCCVCDGTGRMVERIDMRKLRKDEIELRQKEGARCGDSSK